MSGDCHFAIMREAIHFFCRRETFRYIFVSISAYVLVLALMFLFVDIIGFKSSLAFFITYGLAYVYDYISSLRFVFNKEHNTKKLVIYVCYLLIFFLIGNAVYLLLKKLGLNYIIQTFLAMVLVFPLRYSALKYIVFR
jgi:putative flippase GtrA